MSRLGIVLSLVLIVAASGVRAQEAVIHIDNFTFNPAELTIKPGTTVTWMNGDDIPHSIVEIGQDDLSESLLLVHCASLIRSRLLRPSGLDDDLALHVRMQSAKIANLSRIGEGHGECLPRIQRP